MSGSSKQKKVLSRREFIVSTASAMGWLIDPGLALKIIHAAQEYGELLPVQIQNPTNTLWYDSDDQILTLNGKRYDCPSSITWSEWFDMRSIRTANENEVKECFIEEGLYDPDSREKFVLPDLSEDIPENLYDHYLAWDFAISDSPEAQAYHYLENLALANATVDGDDPLGTLDFVQGPHPGSNFTYVEASGLELVSGLQRRLLELGEDIIIKVN